MNQGKVSELTYSYYIAPILVSNKKPQIRMTVKEGGISHFLALVNIFLLFYSVLLYLIFKMTALVFCKKMKSAIIQ